MRKIALFSVFILLGLIIGIVYYWPDGKLHIYFCDVGQGDAIYIRLPNSTDMLIDGGPDNSVLSCLSSHMPFFDRTIEIVVLTHPQKDHYQGLIQVFNRYHVDNFVTVPVGNVGENYQQLVTVVKDKSVRVRYMTSGDRIKIGESDISVLWPQKQWLITDLQKENQQSVLQDFKSAHELLSLKTDADLNQYCLYLHLKYKTFDVLFTGDGDQSVQKNLKSLNLFSTLPANVELLKVPHHGSKTGIFDETIIRLKPKVSVIEVGKNNYGHPSPETMKRLEKFGKVLTTQKFKTIEVKTDGKMYQVLTHIP